MKAPAFSERAEKKHERVLWRLNNTAWVWYRRISVHYLLRVEYTGLNQGLYLI